MASGTALADQSTSPLGYGHGDAGKLPGGVIGISLHIGAERIRGRPSCISMSPPGGLRTRPVFDTRTKLISVDGIPVKGKRYEEVLTMIRGEAGTIVKVGAKDDKGLHELSIERIEGGKLPKGPSGSHGNSAPST
ncbi:MAG: hypothetical protein MRJ68_00585 [Nitrospira sp.]|nr:hypothetical protein [Nitrospira sp.]